MKAFDPTIHINMDKPWLFMICFTSDGCIFVGPAWPHFIDEGSGLFIVNGAYL